MIQLKEVIPGEVWKSIPGYEGYYEASSFGRIRSLDRLVNHNYGGKALKKGRILAKRINGNGYYDCGLCVNQKLRVIQVHVLVCMAFYPNPERKGTVNHKDLDKLNNYASNLEWATHKENVHHFIASGRKRIPNHPPHVRDRITKASMKKVTLLDIHSNEERQFESVNSAAEYIGIDQSTISQAIKRGNLVSKKYRIRFTAKTIQLCNPS